MVTTNMDKPINVLPEFSLDQTNLPAIKGWKVGTKYNLTMQVEMTSIGKDSYDNENELRARFKVMKVAVDGDANTPDPSMMNAKDHQTYMAGERAKAAKAA